MINEEKGYFFDGPFAEYCLMYVDYKKALGYKFQASSYYRLRQIDNFFKKYNLEQQILTQKMVDDYVRRRGNESTKTQHQRMSTIRQFALFMNTLGFTHYVFPQTEFVKKLNDFIPYIFTHEEMAKIWFAVDDLKYSPSSPSAHLIYPMLLRMVYSCGLRINEALGLQKSDFNLSYGLITVKKGKNNTTRFIPMSDSLMLYCREYIEQMAFDMNTEGYFYPAPDGRKYNSGSILSGFRNILCSAGIIASQAHAPRVHDLRHTFAVHALEKMVRDGQDIYYALPILQTYMGHRDVESTEKYLRLTSEAYRNIIDSTATMYDDVFPEVSEDESI